MKHITLARLLAALACLSGATGCETATQAMIEPDEDISQGSRIVAITYLIAHGMAESFVMSGRASAAGLVDLVRDDRAALDAIQKNAINPSWGGLQAADKAVRVLIDATAMKKPSRLVQGKGSALEPAGAAGPRPLLLL